MFYLVPAGHLHSTTACAALSQNTKTTATENENAGPKCSKCWEGVVAAPAPAADKPAQCAGSGTDLDRSLPYRTGFYSGNYGTCPVCGGKPSLTSRSKLRGHKAA